ncbi:MAG: sugar fermentation stimulation protein [Lachnospiraceae bacterium]|nr:sugar fermentation stimulation protein [Lachnospiraceae bacterium]
MKFIGKEVNKKFIKKIICCFLASVLTLSIFSCSDNMQIIDYGVEVVETVENENIEFSFEKDIINETKSQVQTKKRRDFIVSENVKQLALKRNKRPEKIKGIYLPAYVVGKEERFNPIFENIKNSCINAIVVDVKDEIGRITFRMDNDFVKSKKTIEAQIKDIDAFVKLCKDNDIYLIARVSSFLDNYITKLDSSLAVHRKDGKYYRDNSGYYWLNPYSEEVKKYLIEIGKGCAKAGFDEVQYDYFRFSADAGMRYVAFSDEETKGKTKIEIITELAQEIYQVLIPENVFVSIDVFGAIMNSYRDQNSIGQEYQTLLKNVDYLCPMVYPSHYANKTFGLDVPDKEPYEAVKNALITSTNTIEKTFDSSMHYGKIRPWLQGFTANYLVDYINYDVKEYKDQIKAVEDAGYDEWLFWHPGGAYKWEAFAKE